MQAGAFADHRLQLYSLVEQRDLRVQSKIASAAQRDSEDMKFIAVLGSFFLPASLVAVSPALYEESIPKLMLDETIFNVPEFQFADGATLFGAYVGITIPLIALVVLLCMARPRLKRLSWASSVPEKNRTELRPPRSGTMVSAMSD